MGCGKRRRRAFERRLTAWSVRSVIENHDIRRATFDDQLRRQVSPCTRTSASSCASSGHDDSDASTRDAAGNKCSIVSGDIGTPRASLRDRAFALVRKKPTITSLQVILEPSSQGQGPGVQLDAMMFVELLRQGVGSRSAASRD